MVLVAKILLFVAGLVLIAYVTYVFVFLFIYIGLASGTPPRVRLLHRLLPGFVRTVARERKIILERMAAEHFSALDKKLIAADMLFWKGLLAVLMVLFALAAWYYLG